MRNNLISYVPHLIAGPHNPIFFRYADIVKNAINEMHLKALPTSQKKLNAEQNVQYDFGPRWWINGGIKVAHLHFEDQVYMLTNEQWKTFSKSLLNGFKEQLSKANSVSFENAQIISNELENIVH
jgi:hypothetical protein